MGVIGMLGMEGAKPPPLAPRALVHHLSPARKAKPHGHRARSVAALAERLAAIRGHTYFGVFEEGASCGAPYVVPDTTLTLPEAVALGIRDEMDLFGGVVPYPVVASKSVTHQLISPDAHCPEGWSETFGAAIRPAVLRGVTAFSKGDAFAAGRRLLEVGAVRLKPAWADGGHGQSVVRDGPQLEASLEAAGGRETETFGIVLEENLEEATTLSVGEIRFDGLTLAYVGTQCTTTDNDGGEAYGGSALTLVRGDLGALLQRPGVDPDLMEAVRLSRIYDRAADACFPGFFASRRNYDVVIGKDAMGVQRIGVLEQSWRIGGASGAEIAALAAFSRDAQLKAVRARCVEVYGADARIPKGADVYFEGEDQEVGHLRKYAIVEARSHA